MTKPILYFLCTGNSCRSQMAEGFAKGLMGEDYTIYSAGIEAHGINPLAVEVMKEKGYVISNQTSDVVSIDLLKKADYVITLCKDANERCPISLPRSQHYHWGFDDPAKATGTQEEILQEFRRVRDEIEEAIKRFSQGDKGVSVNFETGKKDLVQRENFGESITKLREKQNFTVVQLAEKLEVSEGYLVKTESNQTEPSKFFIHRLAKACDVNYEELIEALYYVGKSNITELLKNN